VVAIQELRKLKLSIAQQDYLKLLNLFSKIVTNIWYNPYEAKYRSLNKEKVVSKLAKWKVGTEGLLFLFQVGFEPSQTGENLIMPSNVLLADLKIRLDDELSMENGNFQPGFGLETDDIAMAIALSKSEKTQIKAQTLNDSGHAMLPYKRSLSAERDAGLGNRTRMVDWVSLQKYKQLHSNLKPKLIPSRGNNNCFWNALYLALEGPCLWSELFASDTFEKHHKRVMNLKAGVAEYVAQNLKESREKLKLMTDILEDNVQAGDEMFGWVASALNIEMTILGPDYNDQALLLNDMIHGVMQWKPDSRFKPPQKAQLAKWRENPDSRLGITMYNKVNVHFDLLVSRDMIPGLVNCTDSEVPRLKPNDRGYLILGEQKEEKDDNLARALALSKLNGASEEKSDMKVSMKPADNLSNISNREGVWDDLEQALALSLEDQKSVEDHKLAEIADVGTTAEADINMNLLE